MWVLSRPKPRGSGPSWESEYDRRPEATVEVESAALSFVSANRDPAIWPDADRLDVTRKVQPNHLTFNHGPHVCIGQSLARLELKVVIEELLARFPDYELLSEPEVTPSTMVNSIRRMPVLFR